MTTRLHLPSIALAASISAVFVLLVSQASCNPHGETNNPVEVGKVIWERDYEAALESAKKSDKPVFLLFQEVPGCAGCKQFGRDVLSDDKVVKAIQDQFIPLLIHNNKPGKDAEILEKFNEPAWNYQVVRFLDAEGLDLIPRKDRVWETAPLLERMKQALAKAGPKKVMTVDTKRQLQGTKYDKIRLTPEQATKVNAFVRTDPARADSHAIGVQR